MAGFQSQQFALKQQDSVATRSAATVVDAGSRQYHLKEELALVYKTALWDRSLLSKVRIVHSNSTPAIPTLRRHLSGELS